MDIENTYSSIEISEVQYATVSTETNDSGKTSSSTVSLNFFHAWWVTYINKFKEASTRSSPKPDAVVEAFAGLLLGIIGMLIAGATDFYFVSGFDYDGTSVPLLTGSYGSTAILVYGVYDVPLAQPRNVICSYVISSFIGVATREICQYIGWPIWVTGAIAVGFTICAMSLTKTNHPPAGAVALTAIIGNERIINLGFLYVLTSFLGSSLLVCVAIVANNMIPTRQYPKFWW